MRLAAYRVIKMYAVARGVALGLSSPGQIVRPVLAQLVRDALRVVRLSFVITLEVLGWAAMITLIVLSSEHRRWDPALAGYAGLAIGVGLCFVDWSERWMLG